MIALVASLASAGFPGPDSNDAAMVVGASVAIALGPVERGRVGGGLDAWLQTQHYTLRTARFEGESYIWAQEHPSTNYGPALHLWRVGGGWNASAGVRVGITWPLRVGLGGGWWPGPGLTVEVAPVIAQRGYVGLDGAVALDLPWTQARLGTALTTHGLDGSRVHLGAFSPLRQPSRWEDIEESWSDPRARSVGAREP